MSTSHGRTARILGVPIVLLGAWAAIVPYVGPIFGYPMPPGSATPAWQWTASNTFLHLLPGVVVIVGGLVLLAGSRRALAGSGAALALVAGAWLAMGPAFGRAGVFGSRGGAPEAEPSTFMQIVTPIGYHFGTGVLIAALAAFALGLIAAARRPERAHEDVVIEEVPEREPARDRRVRTPA